MPAPRTRSTAPASSPRPGATPSGGWGLVLVDLLEPPRPLTLSDGAIIGSSSREARVDGAGVAPEHVRVNVRSDGCYVEDLGSPEGTYVGGVRARRINVMHGDVVRLGRQLAIFVERDLAVYTGPIERTGSLLHGPKQRRDWIGPVLELARSGSCVCIEGGAGVGKRSLARIAASLRESGGEVVVVDGARSPRARRARPATAPGTPGRPPGSSSTPTVSRGRCSSRSPTRWGEAAAPRSSLPSPSPSIAPRATATSRPGSPRCSRASASPSRPSTPGGRTSCPSSATSASGSSSRSTGSVPSSSRRSCGPAGRAACLSSKSTLAAAFETTPEGPLSVSSIAGALSRPMRVKPSLPPSTDPGLARARLEDALARANGSVASAARALGMSRQAIYREADRLGLDIARRKARS